MMGADFDRGYTDVLNLELNYSAMTCTNETLKLFTTLVLTVPIEHNGTTFDLHEWELL